MTESQLRGATVSCFELDVNRMRHRIWTDPGRSLLHVLREDLYLTGSKPGCGEGACGACTVLIDGCPVRSCVTPVGEAVGRQVTTIEGVARYGRLHPLQESILEEDALQCGFCTPGMIMSGIGLLSTNPAPTTQEIVTFMEGNLCRCGAYPRIVRAILDAARVLREGRDDG